MTTERKKNKGIDAENDKYVGTEIRTPVLPVCKHNNDLRGPQKEQQFFITPCAIYARHTIVGTIRNVSFRHCLVQQHRHRHK